MAALVAIARDIKLTHSVFALPFALLAMCLAAGSEARLPTAIEITLIVICMVLGRTVAMTVNRLADARFDADNPRTAGRAIPSGRVTPRAMRLAAITCAVGFILAAGGFWLWRDNPWPLLLSPLVLAYLAAYSYTKRFTWACHLYLGAALAISPLAAVIAIAPAYLGQPAPWLIAALVVGWVAGFDIIYALQDVAVDQAQQLWSLPSRLGIEPALWISRALHLAASAALLLAWYLSPQLGPFFLAAAIATVALLLLEHTLVWRSHTHHIHLAFFTLNGLISLLLGAAGILDVIR